MHFPTELLLCQNQGAKCTLQVPHGLALLLECQGAPSTKSWAAERLPSCTSRLPASFCVLGGCLSPKVFLICRESVRLAALMAGIDAAAGAPRLETRAVPEVSARAREWLCGEVTRDVCQPHTGCGFAAFSSSCSNFKGTGSPRLSQSWGQEQGDVRAGLACADIRRGAQCRGTESPLTAPLGTRNAIWGFRIHPLCCSFPAPGCLYLRG